MNIRDYLRIDSVVFSSGGDKESVIRELVNRAAELGLVKSSEAFGTAVLERETIMSTGIGLGVAVPHAKMKEIPDFLIIPCILSKPVNWDSIDRQPVSLVFLIGGPADRQNDYLKILSKITLVIKNPQRREVLMGAKDSDAVLAEFTEL